MNRCFQLVGLCLSFLPCLGLFSSFRKRKGLRRGILQAPQAMRVLQVRRRGTLAVVAVVTLLALAALAALHSRFPQLKTAHTPPRVLLSLCHSLMCFSSLAHTYIVLLSLFSVCLVARVSLSKSMLLSLYLSLSQVSVYPSLSHSLLRTLPLPVSCPLQPSSFATSPHLDFMCLASSLARLSLPIHVAGLGV